MPDIKFQIFRDIPDDLDETWTHVALFGAMADLAHNNFSLAENFRLAGDILVRHGLSEFDAYELLYPVLYNYRHALELYLKAVVKPEKRSHDLNALMQRFKKYMKENHNQEVPAWFEKIVDEFIHYDPSSTTFRYPERTNAAEERIVHLPELRQIMEIVSDAFRRIMLNKPNNETR